MMRREQGDLGWLFKIGQKSLMLVFGGLLTISSTATAMESSVKDAGAINGLKSTSDAQMIAAQDNVEAEADRLRQEGERLVKQGTDESRRQAIEAWKKAIQMYLKIDLKKGSYYPLLLTEMIGRVYYELNDFKQSVEYLESAIQTYRELRQPEIKEIIPGEWQQVLLESEIKALKILTQVYGALGDAQKFSEYREEALKLYNESQDQEKLADFLSETGVLYRGLGEWDKALASYDQALSILVVLFSKG